MKTEILKLLRESKDYVSGQQLCETFGVSRTAVWKVMNQLKEEGYEVEAVRNRGYRIVGSADVMTQEELESLLDGRTKWAGQHVVYSDEIDSTNIKAKQLGEEGASHGTLVVADMQTAGRGRRGRGWDSPSGSSIYMSIMLRPKFPPVKAPMLTIVMAYSVARALRTCTGLDVQIKWPNDIILNGKKIVGILTEMSTEIDYINHVVIGVGINVNLAEIQEELKDKATSLYLETGKIYDRNRLIGLVMGKFEKNYEKFVQTCDLSLMIDDYNMMLANKCQPVRILDKLDPYEGVALGIDREGELLVRVADGRIRKVCSGEVSVRGLYSYV